ESDCGSVLFGGRSGSKYSTPTVYWKASPETAVVGFWWSRRLRRFTCRFAYWPMPDELCSISPRGKFAGADLSVAQVCPRACLGGWRMTNLEMLCHHQAISHNRRRARKHSLRGKCPLIQGTRVDRRECRALN